MFSIIISEKGGAERRESFDKNEINVGRVQGNDLMLPKGNVSKHHARLLFRDGRFIVTDLKSTNGTYVNGRKIAQATIVREGDKIYIGDFVLRLETNGAAAAQASPAPGPDSRDQPPPPPRPHSPAVTLKAPTHPPGAPLPRPQPQNVSSVPTGLPVTPPVVFPETETDEGDESDVQKPARIAAGAVPLGGGGPLGPRPLTMPLNQMSPPPLMGQLGQRPATAPPPAGGAPPPAPLGSPPAVAAPPPFMAPAPPAPPMPRPEPVRSEPPAPPLGPPALAPTPAAPGRVSAPPPRMPPKETPAQAGRRLALMTLLDRIADAVDLSQLANVPQVPDVLAQQIERAARDQASAMRDEGDAPEGIDLDTVVRDAHRELVGVGPFGALLDDEEVTEIACLRFDQIFAVRGGTMSSEPSAFSSEEALARAIARLAFQSGDPWKPGEQVIERRLSKASFVAIAPPASSGYVVSIQKRRRIEASLDDLTRAGSMSRAMSQFVEACVQARANVLVSGNAPLPLLAALAASGSGSERVVVVQDFEEVAVPQPHAVALSVPDTRRLGEECVRGAAKLRSDRLVVTRLAGGVAAATLDAMADGSDGVLGALAAPTLRQGLSRLTAQLVLHRPGLALDAMRDVIGEAFDVAVEVSLFPDGRFRVMRIAELGGADAKGIVVRDVFVFNPDASGDGSFSATGVVPRIANDLAARGMKLDPSTFKRSGR